MGVFMILIGLTILLGLLFKYLGYKSRTYFESRGIPYNGNGTVRLFTNLYKGIGLLEDINIQYRILKSKNIKVAGADDFGMKTLVIQDPELLKSILVKDFDHFANRREFKMSKNDMLFRKMLFSLRGAPWRVLRSKLSPTFTTGKIKRLFSVFDASGKKFVKFLEQEVAKSPDAEMDINDGYSKFTMDIIASAVCGLDSQAFDQKEPSLFERMGMKMQLQFGGAQLVKIMVLFTFPKIADWMGLSFFEKEVQEFFSGAIKSSIHERQAKGEKRNDFIQLMLEARDDKLKTDESELDNFEKDAMFKDKQSIATDDDKASTKDILDDDGIVANSVLFMLAGYDTTQSLLIFVAYSLALNQDIQDKLRAEVDSVLEDNDGEFSYDAMNKMTYLDMVINETLRFYPPAVATDRGCTMDYKIPGTDFVLKKGEGIIIPIYGLHHDEEYYPEPEKFDPERFSPENKGKINQYAFLPFGQGPRNCIGMRFALAEVKVAISHLVHNFRIEPSKKTLIPMKFSKSNSLKPEGGMFLALNKIQH